MGGETLSIGEDRHTRVNGKRLEATSSPPHFENVYGFNPNDPTPRESRYSGHVTGFTQLDPRSVRLSLLCSAQNAFHAVFGDNTMNSTELALLGRSAAGKRDRKQGFFVMLADFVTIWVGPAVVGWM